MKTSIVMSVIAVVFFVPAVQADYGRHAYSARSGYNPYYDQIDQRQHRQQHLINRGIRNGELTRKELNKIHRKQNKIARMERNFKRDGWVSRREQEILNRKLNKNHRLIKRLKGNHRVRQVNRYRGYPVAPRASYGYPVVPRTRYGYSSGYRGNDFSLSVGSNSAGLFLHW